MRIKSKSLFRHIYVHMHLLQASKEFVYICMREKNVEIGTKWKYQSQKKPDDQHVKTHAKKICKTVARRGLHIWWKDSKILRQQSQKREKQDKLQESWCPNFLWYWTIREISLVDLTKVCTWTNKNHQHLSNYFLGSIKWCISWDCLLSWINRSKQDYNAESRFNRTNFLVCQKKLFTGCCEHIVNVFNYSRISQTF